ncbi:MAG: efflux RND transporter periplasmic adaptor subunit [Candidatus Nitricoxidivorans perseverans]|uniref:Efflux RND transporter periplasmic adaptor subunit n=1 Tax=Candidatus Nitricoxidivorans perseverans TaxID=2975601 RepID=A0AA49FKK8_9PROT|nr:MAG: efflux RND transporter periplasmic adaptor subunit [Candidatus Nitricoxidivorans perseverans]
MRLFIAMLAAGLVACGGKPEEKKPSGPPPALITTTTVQPGAFEVVEETLGTLESINDPRLAAEVAGKVARVLAFAGKAVKKGETLAVIDAADLALQTQADASEAARLEALLAQQEKLVERQQGLVAKGFLSQNAADDARAQRAALAGQLAAARARTDLSRRNVGKTAVAAPTDGVIENQMVSAGDYVKVGDPLFQFVSNRRLRAHLPFPETAAPRLARGQPVRLTSPQAPGRVFEGIINDIRPSLADGSRALTAVVNIDNDGALKSGGTVNALVRIAAREGALTVPEQSVVLRPAGKVVYVVADGKATQRVVQTGGKRAGRVEIHSGLSGGETVALDGAGFLTHDAAVAVKK